MINREFWRGRRVFLTGHTGFKGSWMALWLEYMGAVVYGYALPPEGKNNLFQDAGLNESLDQLYADISDLPRLRSAVAGFKPQIVIHMAAQPLVKESYINPVDTFATNIIGTVNVLAALEGCPSLEAAVVVTSDKCYQNQELDSGYKEDHPMGGHDPYSSSKACAELVTASWYKSFVQGHGVDGQHKFGLATARAGNVIGGGDWARDRLIPDILRAIKRGEPVEIRNPHAVRPWQYVLEPLAGYLRLAQHLVKDSSAFSEAWNFGPAREDVRPVGWLVEQLLSGLGKQTDWHYVEDPAVHETNRLFLDCSKSRNRLGWSPVYGLEEAVSKIVHWHQALEAGADMRKFMVKEIVQHMKLSSRDSNG